MSRKSCLTRWIPLLMAAIPCGAAPSTPVFSRDVAPILFKHCVECHRAGEVAPMPLTSYKEVRPWAKAIRERVVSRTMPMWPADPHYGSFENDRRLTQNEIDTIAKWVGDGAPEGDPQATPAVPQFNDGWKLGEPDKIIEIGGDVEIPAVGVIPYKTFTVPSGFTEDKWISAVEVRPGNRGVLHHVVVLVKPPETGPEPGALLTCYLPGEQPYQLKSGTAKLVKAGSKFWFQMHYSADGTPRKDRSYLGLHYAKGPVLKRAFTEMAGTVFFKIPPGSPNYEVKSTWTAKDDVELISLMPHMHLRGKDFQYTIVYPDGRREVALRVPRYNFDWQFEYDLKKPLHLPSGTRIEVIAHFDNSANNPSNPDPDQEVGFGEQVWEEMITGFFTYVMPRPTEVLTAAK